MPRPPIDLNRKVREILAHADPLPAEASTPLAHCNRSSTDLWNLLLYVERNSNPAPRMRRPAGISRTVRHGLC
jgi:hypothetical protein